MTVSSPRQTSTIAPPGSPDLRRLRLFVELAKDLNFTRSSRRQHVSQPALSQNIKLLERELGVQLFVRSGRGVTLTRAGRALLGPAQDLLDHAQRLTALAGRLEDASERRALAGRVRP